MAEVDTSSYPRPAASVNALDTVAKLGGLQQQKQQIESGAIQIDKQKLDLANQAIGYMTRAFASAGPDASKEQLASIGDSAAKMFNLPPQMVQEYKARLAAAPTARHFFDEVLTQAANHQEVINYHIGQPGFINDQQTATPVRTPLKTGAPIPTGQPIQIQPAPTTEIPTDAGPQQLGPYKYPNSSGLPVAEPRAAGGAINAPGGLPVASAANGAPTGPVTGRPPAYDIGLKQRAEDQQIALDRASAIKPALQALPLMEGLRSGPGTAPWNNAVAFLKANNIISTANENDPTAIYQEVNKKLSQYVQGAGTRSDADLAKKEESNPSAKTQINPALVKLTQDAVALDRVRIALPGAFNDKDLSKYGNHRATFPTTIDEKAFTLDMMKDAEREKLLDDMYKEKNTPKATKFWKSLAIARQAGFYNISGQ